MSDGEFDSNVLSNVSDFSEHVSNSASLRTNLLTMTDENVNGTLVSLHAHSISSIKPVPLRTWKPSSLPTHAVHQLPQRRIYSGNHEVREPRRAVRIPVQISIFGEKIKGIIDTGSDRSFLSVSAYERVRNYQLKELKRDGSSRRGVRLGNTTIFKTQGGTGFIIDIGDVYGPQ